MDDADLPSTLPSLLSHHVRHFGSRDAIATSGETLSYSQLEQRSAAMARSLLSIGAGKGTRIALLAPGGILWLTAYVAALRIGALVSLVSTLCTAPELAYILRQSDCQILIGIRRYLRHDYARTLLDALPGLSAATAEALRLPAAPHLRSIWLDDADDLGWAGSIGQLLQRSEAPDAPDAALLSAVEQEVTPADDAVVVFTSGSTSNPKAVVHTQRNLTRFPLELAKFFLLKPQDRMLPHLPVFWLGGLGMTMQVLAVGATLVYPDSPEPESTAETLERCRVNRVNSWGDVMVKLRQAAAARGLDVDGIVGLGPFRDSAGELIAPELHASPLGMTETFTAHSAEPLDVRMPPGKAGSAGRAVGGFERRVVDPETGAVVGAGQVGELQVRGGGLMSGFYKVPRDKVFTSDGYYPTGDLVRIDEEGYLFFIGRRGDMIKTRAANVSRLEVEAAMRTLPGIEVPLVVGLPDAELGQRVVAAVVPKAGVSLNEADLRALLRDLISSYKIPRNIVFITEDEIPRTATGKLKLHEIARLIASRLAARSSTAQAEQPT
jgi:acyl-CoA synthetase (AMP-forming)/AMP-acid ligase II